MVSGSFFYKKLKTPKINYEKNRTYACVYEKFRISLRAFNENDMIKDHPKPTDAELEILQVLWQSGPSSVRQVHESLSGDRDTGYTTTLKLMQIMAEKGLVQRDTNARSHIYEAAIAEAEVQQQLLRRFVDTAFRGSAMSLVMQALGQHQADSDELDQIKALIEQMEQNQQLPQ